MIGTAIAIYAVLIVVLVRADIKSGKKAAKESVNFLVKRKQIK